MCVTLKRGGTVMFCEREREREGVCRSRNGWCGWWMGKKKARWMGVRGRQRGLRRRKRMGRWRRPLSLSLSLSLSKQATICRFVAQREEAASPFAGFAGRPTAQPADQPFSAHQLRQPIYASHTHSPSAERDRKRERDLSRRSFADLPPKKKTKSGQRHTSQQHIAFLQKSKQRWSERHQLPSPFFSLSLFLSLSSSFRKERTRHAPVHPRLAIRTSLSLFPLSLSSTAELAFFDTIFCHALCLWPTKPALVQNANCTAKSEKNIFHPT